MTTPILISYNEIENLLTIITDCSNCTFLLFKNKVIEHAQIFQSMQTFQKKLPDNINEKLKLHNTMLFKFFTFVQIWYSFEKEGIYVFENIQIFKGGSFYSYPFDKFMDAVNIFCTLK